MDTERIISELEAVLESSRDEFVDEIPSEFHAVSEISFHDTVVIEKKFDSDKGLCSDNLFMGSEVDVSIGHICSCGQITESASDMEFHLKNAIEAELFEPLLSMEAQGPDSAVEVERVTPDLWHPWKLHYMDVVQDLCREADSPIQSVVDGDEVIALYVR